MKNANEDCIEKYQSKDLQVTGLLVAGPESPKQRLNHLLELLHKSIVPKLNTSIKDDWHFLRFLPSETDFECDLYSCDRESLFTSIPTELGQLKDI